MVIGFIVVIEPDRHHVQDSASKEAIQVRFVYESLETYNRSEKTNA